MFEAPEWLKAVFIGFGWAIGVIVDLFKRSRVVLVTAEGSRVTGVEVFVGIDSLGLTDGNGYSRRFRVSPGTYEFRVHLPNGQVHQQRLEVSESTRCIVLDLPNDGTVKDD